MSEAFFVDRGQGRFVGTAHTIGPWDAAAMHFGPPAALLGRAVERAATEVAKRVTRLTFEVLRPVPVGDVVVSAEVVRPGRRIDLVEARLTDGDGTPLALARGWRMRTADVPVPPEAAEGPATPPPDQGEPTTFFPTDVPVHYGNSMDVRFLTGSFLVPGPAVAWMRATVPLVAGEAISPLQRVLVAADSGNGISAVADPARLLFVNTDLTVHLHRLPVGEWVCLNARTVLSPDGIGQAETVLSDERGRIGRAMQSLFVDAR